MPRQPSPDNGDDRRWQIARIGIVLAYYLWRYARDLFLS
jgi:hypothetical protein